MKTSPRNGGRLDEAEAWWAFVLRIMLALLGMVLLGHTALVSQAELTEKLIWIGVAIGLMGQVAVSGVAQALAVLRGRRE